MSAVWHVSARITEDRARRLSTGRGRWLPALLGRPSNARSRRLELVWLVHYLVPYSVDSRNGPGVITASIEGRSGAFAIFDMRESLREGHPAGDVIPPSIPEAEVVERGRHELMHAILRQSSRGAKPAVTGVGTVERLCYPFWVHYYERRRGLLDVVVIDAITGYAAGGKIKSSILQAFKESARMTANPW